MHRHILGTACVLLAWGSTPSCVSVGRDVVPTRSQQTRLTLAEANFDVLSVHNVGRAYQDTALLFFFVGGDDEPLTKAWEEMKASSGIEGRAAEFVNVAVDRTDEWLLWPFFWRSVITVTADAIAFRTQEDPEIPTDDGERRIWPDRLPRR